uniref:Uncharacterized protein n=1 Tax=Chelativorans sp. (strain BNC1) TaxID=266779 RepID=Q11IP2_CHESB
MQEMPHIGSSGAAAHPLRPSISLMWVQRRRLCSAAAVNGFRWSMAHFFFIHRFLLHPPALMVQEAPWTVDELRQMDEMINISANFSTEAYKTCTSMPEEEIRAISYSENQRLVLTAEQAREKGLISGTVDGIIDTSISYVVSD